MKKLLLPLILILLGGGGGTAAGYFLKKPQEPAGEHDVASAEHGEATDAHEPEAHGESHGDSHGDSHGGGDEEDYIKLQNQFVVPVIHHGKMQAMVIMSLSIEADAQARPIVIKREPKLRATLLRVMFDHSNIGGFDGNFIHTGPMEMLHSNLLMGTRAVIGEGVHNVHIQEIARQDLE